jgi:TolB-like protein/DNA-binding winged helix-turn-helix (wHTH) protein
MPVPEESHPSRGVIRFGSFELDLRAGELYKHGIRLKLQDQPFRLLEILLERPAEVVTREELQRRIWPSDTFVDFDRGLNNAVKRLREALTDSAEEPRYIETLPKRGYRFIAKIQPPDIPEMNGVGTAATDVPGERGVPPAGETSRRIVPRMTVLTIASAVLLAISLVFLVRADSVWGHLMDRWSTPAIHSIAVLPLQSLSNNPNQEFFADGITDALITDLAQIRSLKVISRTSTARYQKTSKSLPEIARELNVEGIVEGTVQQFGDRVRITTQLIHGPTDTHLWARSYERNSQDVLALEQDVANAITDEIRATVTPNEKARLSRQRSVSLSSLQAYVQGKYHLERADASAYRADAEPTSSQELATARKFLEQAVRGDPEYAQAYVGLAETWGGRPMSENGPDKAQALLQKALELDPDLAEAHEALATLDVLRQWKWSEAEIEYRHAIELNPSFAEAHARYGEYLDMMGRFDEGMKEFLRAQELDPGHNFNPNPFYRRRQYDRAIEIDENEVRRQAFGFWSHANLAYDFDGAGRHEEAAQQWGEMLRMLGYTELADAMQRELPRRGYRGALRTLTEGLETRAARGTPPPAFFPAMMYGMLGENDRAFNWLEQGYRDRDASFSGLNVDPCWDPLRSDPRFADLVRRVGLPRLI